MMGKKKKTKRQKAKCEWLKVQAERLGLSATRGGGRGR